MARTKQTARKSTGGVVKSKRTRTPKFSILTDRKDKLVVLRHRAPFNAGANKIKVNRDATMGVIEDRRHMVHWDEELKPMVAKTLTAIFRKHPVDHEQVLRDRMADSGLKRLPADWDKLCARFATEINSCRLNLVPDDAATNQAIEKVRICQRNYLGALRVDPMIVDSLSTLSHNAAVMARYQKIARDHFTVGRTDTPIKTVITDINTRILSFIDCCDSPSELWDLLNETIYSITFDLSPKARREQTARIMAWQREMLTVMTNGDADKMLDGMLSFLSL